jgi:hypothetical protein
MVVFGKLSVGFPLLWLLVALLTVLIFEVGRMPQVSAWLSSDTWVPWLVRTVSNLSLEVFLVHVVLVRGIEWTSRYFPFNLIVLVFLSLAISWPLNWIASTLR